MTLYDSTGNKLTEASLQGHLTAVPAPPAQFTVGEAVYEDFDYGDVSTLNGGAPPAVRSGHRRLKWSVGEVISQTDLNTAFAPGTVTSVNPNAAAVAGGTALTIMGTGLASTTGVTVGGTAVTSYNVVNDSEITVVAPAHAAGAVAVVVTTEAGAITVSGAVTYA